MVNVNRILSPHQTRNGHRQTVFVRARVQTQSKCFTLQFIVVMIICKLCVAHYAMEDIKRIEA